MLLRSFIWVLVFSLQTAAASHRSSLPRPVDVVFTSLNLRNQVQWDPGRRSPNPTHYNVEYAIYGDREEGGKRRLRWRAKRQCRDIARTWCDLTDETTDLEDEYFARVRAVGSNASSGWTVTRKFSPKSDTVVGPPHLAVSVQDSTAVVRLNGPMRWPIENQTEEIPMAHIYPQMTFNLSVYHGGRNQTRHFPLESGFVYRYRLLDYETEFCFSANARFLSLILHCQPSPWHCITTPEDPVIHQLKLVLLGVVVPSCFLFILFLVGCLLYHFVQGKEQRSPPVLDIAHLQTPPRTFSPEIVNIILINMVNTTEMPHSPKPHPCPDLPPPCPTLSEQQRALPFYNPQLEPEAEATAPEASWEDESLEQRVEVIDYGFVGAAALNQDQDQDQTQSHTQDQAQSHTQDQAQSHTQDQAQSHTQDQAQSHTQDQAQSHTQDQAQSHTQDQAQSHTQDQAQSHTQDQTQSHTQDQTQTQAQAPCPEQPEMGSWAGIPMQRDPLTGLFHIALPGPLRVLGGRSPRRWAESEHLLPYAPQLCPERQSPQPGQWQDGAGSYGVVGLAPENQGQVRNREDSQPLLMSGVNLYTAQRHSTAGEEEDEEEEEEESGHCVDWNPETGKLHIPSLILPWEEEEEKKRGMERGLERCREPGHLDAEEMLPSVLVRQSSEESESESDLARLQNTWSLQINMEQ